MKKKYGIIIAIAVIIILLAIVAVVVYNKKVEDNQDYEIEQVKEYNYFVLKQDEKYGVMDKEGNIVITPEYEEVRIPNPEKGVFVCYQEENSKVLNEKKEEILTQYSEVQPIRLKNIASDLMYERSVLQYKENNKYGLISFDGKEIAKPIYDEIDSLAYKEGEVLVKQNGKYGVINIKGKELIEIKYDKIAIDEYYTDENHYQYAGYIVSITTQEGYRYGYLNYERKEILGMQYNEMTRVTEMQDNENAYLICAKNGQYGIMKNEELIVANEYQSIRYNDTNKVFVVEKSKKYGVMNLKGEQILPVQYQQIDITGMYLYAQNEQGITVYNCDGTQVEIDSNVAILNTNNEKYKIKINNQAKTQYGLLDSAGNQLIEEKYNYIQYLYDNYFIVSNESGKLGVVDDKDNSKIETNNDSLQKIQDTDLIQTKRAENEKQVTQIYDKTMNKICEMQNATILVEENHIKVYNETEMQYFSKGGKPLQNTQVYPNNKLFVKVENNQYGFVDKDGKLVVNCQYDKALEFNSYGFAAVKREGKWGVVNEQGQEIVAPTYELSNESEPFFIGSYYRVVYGFGEFYYTNAK